jgi:hypothetical protein
VSTFVFTTFGGRRFHDDSNCEALEAGRGLSWNRYEVRVRRPEDAARAGYTACRVCVPPALALPATGQTYGHEPVPYLGRHIVCRRCTDPYTWWGARARRRVPSPMPWPCTSAAVLGLVVTDADRWNARYPVGTPVAAYPWVRADEPLHTRTRTPAWRLGHGDSVVSVDGHTGGICLTHVDPL